MSAMSPDLVPSLLPAAARPPAALNRADLSHFPEQGVYKMITKTTPVPVSLRIAGLLHFLWAGLFGLVVAMPLLLKNKELLKPEGMKVDPEAGGGQAASLVVSVLGLCVVAYTLMP